MLSTPCPTLHREIRAYLEIVDMSPRLHRELTAPKGRVRANYVVIANMPGYLPEDDDPPTFDCYDEAWSYVVQEVSEYINDLREAGERPSASSDKAFGWAHVEAGNWSRNWSVNSLLPCDE